MGLFVSKLLSNDVHTLELMMSEIARAIREGQWEVRGNVQDGIHRGLEGVHRVVCSIDPHSVHPVPSRASLLCPSSHLSV